MRCFPDTHSGARGEVGWRHREKESGRIQTIPVQRTTRANSSPSRFEHGCFKTGTLNPRETPSCLGTQTLNPRMLGTNYKQKPKENSSSSHLSLRPPSIYSSILPSTTMVHLDVFHPGHNTHVAFVIHPSTMVHLDVVPSYPDIHMEHLSIHPSIKNGAYRCCFIMGIYTYGASLIYPTTHPSIHNGASRCCSILAKYTHGPSIIHPASQPSKMVHLDVVSS